MRVKSKTAYEKELKLAIEERHGEYIKFVHGLTVSKAASDLHHLDLIDSQLESADFLYEVSGAMGQVKNEINPLIAARDKASRTAMDALDSLQLTPRSSYKKQDAKGKKEDSFNDFFEDVQ